jgi:putative ABC transport system permease protein
MNYGKLFLKRYLNLANKKQNISAPAFPLKLLKWLCKPEYHSDIEGDLLELYDRRVTKFGERTARILLFKDVILLLRPGIIRPVEGHENLITSAMFRSYFMIGWRNLLRYKGYSAINIAGLAMGMAVAILIGLWMYDELSFDTHHPNHDRIAQVMQHTDFNGAINTGISMPAVMGEEIRNVYGNDFKYVLQSTWNFDHILAYGDKIFLKTGSFIEPGVTEMLSLKMVAGTRDGLKDMNSILLSESVASAYFGEDDPMDKILRIDNKTDVNVTGVYEDLPDNTSFRNLKFILPWDLYLSLNSWIREKENPWGSNFTQTFVQIADHADMDQVSARIKDVKANKMPEEVRRRYNPVVFLHPMNKWHLYSDFKNGVNTGGAIDNVLLFGITAVFVLLLACINFMNLSTARSEKRSKEVGIRKSIGSARGQLIVQFFSESVMMSLFALCVALILVMLILPSFNVIADKKISILWTDPVFWLIGIGFSVVTGLFAGLYPALFLSSFQPVKVLKGTFKAGRFASLPRKVLVVMQFTISITLVIGTMVVYKQISHGQNRPLGYSRDGLVSVSINEERHKHFEVIRKELKDIGAIVEMAESGSPTTEHWNTNLGFDWEGKDPNQGVDFPNNTVSHDYGKTIGWEIKEGRDFSRDFASDSAAFILNESAVKFIGLKDPIGKVILWEGRPYTIIGVVKDLLVQSPYRSVRPSLFHLSTNHNVLILKINPEMSTRDALEKIETVFRKYNPSSPFQADFADEEFARKFGNEKRIGTLAAFFAILAILISCLGLLGLASFVAEQRTKEIGIRKILGASVTNLWQMLSKDFVALVILSCLISIPLAYHYLNNWLQAYEYRTDIPWWIFAASCFGALVITFVTVSFQSTKAAMMNPVKSLRSE